MLLTTTEMQQSKRESASAFEVYKLFNFLTKLTALANHANFKNLVPKTPKGTASATLFYVFLQCSKKRRESFPPLFAVAYMWPKNLGGGTKSFQISFGQKTFYFYDPPTPTLLQLPYCFRKHSIKSRPVTIVNQQEASKPEITGFLLSIMCKPAPAFKVN